MKFLKYLLVLVLAGLVAPGIFAAGTVVDLTLAADTARPGDTVMAGVRLKMQPQWHTYWRNPGGPGQATSIAWQLPAGVTAGDIKWPVPEKLPAEELTTYVYQDEVVLLVPLRIAATVPPGRLEIKATVHWLECNTACLMGHGDVAATLTVGDATKPGAGAALIDAWRAKLPLVKADLDARAWWGPVATNDTRPLFLEWAAAAGGPADFYPFAADKFDVQFSVESLPTETGKVRLQKIVKKFEGDWPDKISGLLVQKKSGGETVAYTVTLPITATNTPVAAVMPTASPTELPVIALPRHSLFFYIMCAFLGGLALNIMPCVLPVIALKVLGFVSQGGNHPGQVRKLGLIYALGVLFSFLILAALVISVKLAGHQAGWGMQFGNPEFLVVMTVLITLVALNLFGVFEINLSGRVMGKAGELSAKEGPAGAFFNGVLATILATPCSAPFLGVALGFAFAQTYPVIVLIFLTVGVGLAAPYVVLSWNPTLLKLLPKPGAWMARFKTLMGFPMLATAVWLFDLTTVHYGRRVLWLALFLVMVAMAAWIYGEFIQRGRSRKGLAFAVVLLIFGGGYLYAVEGQLKWRSPMIDDAGMPVAHRVAGGIEWQPWSTEAVAQARGAGHPVLVDFTADWCLVCQVNRKTSLDISRVEKKIKELNVVALEADYSKSSPIVLRELNRFGRATVPLVVVFPASTAKPPVILPDGYLTPGIVLDALDKTAMN